MSAMRVINAIISSGPHNTIVEISNGFVGDASREKINSRLTANHLVDLIQFVWNTQQNGTREDTE